MTTSSERPVLMHVALDAVDARGLAEFYRRLLGVRYRDGDATPDGSPLQDADWLVLVDDDGRRVLAVQRVASLARPTWPEPGVDQQVHLDFRLPSRAALEASRAEAEALGAVLLLDRTDDPDEPLYVLADPAGHPFCLMVSAG